MDFYTDGCYDKEEKKNLYDLKTNLLTNKYYSNKKNNIENDIYKDLKEAIKNLKQIENLYSNSNIEYIRYKKSSQPMFLWQEKLVNSYKFFCIILGIIDGQLDKINRDINFELNFVDDKTSKLSIKNNESLNKLFNEKEEFLTYRKIIVEDYKKYGMGREPKIVNESITNYPSHQYFNECFNDIVKNSYQLNLQVEFINNYTKGYNCSRKINFNKIYDLYKILFEELMQFKIKLKNNEEKIKEKKQKRV